jgi:hypothetical protein
MQAGSFRSDVKGSRWRAAQLEFWMQRAVHSLIVSMVALLGVVMVAVLAASVAVAASALIVQGTGTPNSNIVAGLRQNARDYYLGNTSCGNATDCPDGNLTGIDYPASFFPLAFIPRWCVPGRCNKWDDSVGKGVANLSSALTPLLDSDHDVAVLGYSQGAAVVSGELRDLGSLSPQQKSRLTVVLIGNIDNPDGGLFTRLGFLGDIPFVDVTTGLPTPTDTGIELTTIDFEYDGVGDFPRYGGNLLAVANAIAGFAYIHGTYLDPNQNGDFVGLPDGYTPAELKDQQDCGAHPKNCRHDANGNTYILIPTKTLPIVQPFLDAASATGTTALVKPVVDLISPTLRVLIDLGYDRTGNPGTYTTLSPLPFNPSAIHPIQLAGSLMRATVAGLQALAGDLGAPPATEPNGPTPVDGTARSATLAAASARTATELLPKGTASVEPASQNDVATVKGDSNAFRHHEADAPELNKDHERTSQAGRAKARRGTKFPRHSGASMVSVESKPANAVRGSASHSPTAKLPTRNHRRVSNPGHA